MEGHCGRHDRQRARMVRLRSLRLLCRRDRPRLLSAGGSRRPGAGGLRHLCGRLSDASRGRRGDRLAGRQVRAESRSHRIGRRHGDSHLSDRLAAGLSDNRARGADRAHRAAHGARALGGRRIYQLDGVPGRACARGTPRLDGCARRNRGHDRHSARLDRRRSLRGQHVDRGPRRLGLARAVPAGAPGRDRGLSHSPLRARDGGGGEAHTRTRRRDAARSLASGRAVRRSVGVLRGDLLYRLRLYRKLAADRRRHSAVTCARDQLVEHAADAAGDDRRRMVERSGRAQADDAPHERGRTRRSPAPVLAAEPSLGSAGAAGADRLRVPGWSLLRGPARSPRGGCARERALHRGGARL